MLIKVTQVSHFEMEFEQDDASLFMSPILLDATFQGSGSVGLSSFSNS